MRLVGQRHLVAVVVARGPSPAAVGAPGVVVRLVDRLPAEHEVAERLGHERHVASPGVGAVGLDEEPALVGEPARQREVVEAHPRRHPGRRGPRRARRGSGPPPPCRAPRAPARGAPIRGTGGGASGRARPGARSPRRSARRSRSRPRTAAPGRPAPSPTSQTRVPRPRTGSTMRLYPTRTPRAIAWARVWQSGRRRARPSPAGRARTTRLRSRGTAAPPAPGGGRSGTPAGRTS